MRDTASVFEHHQSAFSAGLDEVMRDYDESSVLVSPDETARGMSEIRAWFERFISAMPQGTMDRLEVTKQEVVGEVAYITFKAEPYVLLGTDTMVVKDGKIAVQTFAAKFSS